MRRNIDHILKCGYFSSELEFFLSLTRVIMPFFHWWYTDIALYEEKDGFSSDWLGRQSLDLFIPSIKTAIEYQGIQHYHPVDFFGGEEALLQRQELDRVKKRLCLDHDIRLIEWPYSKEPTVINVERETENRPLSPEREVFV